MPVVESSNKRIAKNTLMLYIRMLISMLVGLYTSRVVLQTLGAEVYGIFDNNITERVYRPLTGNVRTVYGMVP